MNSLPDTSNVSRMVEITYSAHMHDPGFLEPVTWTHLTQLTPAQHARGPGYLLESRRTGQAGGITVEGSFYPLSSIARITWEVAEL